jgi:hypothetical protein
MTEDCFKRMVASIRSKLHSAVVGAVGWPRWLVSVALILMLSRRVEVKPPTIAARIAY